MGQVFKKFICCLTLVMFIFTSVTPSYGQSVLSVPAPTTLVQLSQPFNPPMLTGIKVHTDNPFRFEFILDAGNNNDKNSVGARYFVPESADIKQEANRLIKYFLASLTVPEKDLWVNLSPYEKDRIVPEAFGKTEMGRDLLAQDYLLKQLTASLMYPEGEIGRKFWDRIYAEAAQKFGTTDIPVDTFNKVWIVPEKAVVYENAEAGTAYVVESHLKVMTEKDYKVIPSRTAQDDNTNKIIKSVIIPALEREVNTGKNFAQLRQVYNSLILATWYKKKIKESILSQVYVNKNKVVGVNIDDTKAAEKIWAQYVETFKKGAYNYIKEEYDPVNQKIIPKKYFSGGFTALNLDEAMIIESKEVPYDPDDPNNHNQLQKIIMDLLPRDTPPFTPLASVTPVSIKSIPPIHALEPIPATNPYAGAVVVSNIEQAIKNETPNVVNFTPQVTPKTKKDKLNEKLEALLGISANEKLRSFISDMLNELSWADNFDSFLISQSKLLRNLLLEIGFTFFDLPLTQRLLALVIEWAINLGEINIDQINWFDGFYTTKPVFAIATTALSGLGDITKIDMVIQGINQELEKLGIKGAKFKVLALIKDKSRIDIFKDKLLEMKSLNVTFEFVEDIIPENSPLLADVDALIALVEPVTTFVKFDEHRSHARSSPLLCWTINEYDKDINPNTRDTAFNFTNLNTGFDSRSIGFFINPFAVGLYNQNLGLNVEGRIQQKEELLRQSLSEIGNKINVQPINVEEKAAQAAATTWGFVYMHRDGGQYLRNLFQYFSEQNITVFTFFGANNRWEKDIDEFVKFKVIVDAYRLPIEIYDLSADPNQIKTIDFSKPVIRVINLGVRDLTTNIRFMAASDLPVGVTGDESFAAAATLRLPFVYEMAPWKWELAYNISQWMRRINGEQGKASKLLWNFIIRETDSAEQDFLWGNSPKKYDEFKRFGDFVESRPLYPDLVRKMLRTLAFLHLMQDRQNKGVPASKKALVGAYNFWTKCRDFLRQTFQSGDEKLKSYKVYLDSENDQAMLQQNSAKFLSEADQKMLGDFILKANDGRRYKLFFYKKPSSEGSYKIIIREIDQKDQVIRGRRKAGYIVIFPFNEKGYRNRNGFFQLIIERFVLFQKSQQGKRISSSFLENLPKGTSLRGKNIINEATIDQMKDEVFAKLKATASDDELVRLEENERYINRGSGRGRVESTVRFFMNYQEDKKVDLHLSEIFRNTPIGKSLGYGGFEISDVVIGEQYMGSFYVAELSYIALKPVDQAMNQQEIIINEELSVKTSDVFNVRLKDNPQEGILQPATVDRREFLKTAVGLAAIMALPGFLRAAEPKKNLLPAGKSEPTLAKARQIVLDHLTDILHSGKMWTNIPSTEYWQDNVFKGDKTMYLFAMDDIEIALKAGLKPYNAGESLNAKEFARLAIQAIKEQTVEEKLDKFFSGSWSRYMVALANNSENIEIYAEVIRQRAKDIDPILGALVAQLADNTKDWQVKDIENVWQKFNDSFLIPKGYYASVSSATNNLKHHKFYFALIYKIESREQTALSSGRKIEVLIARRLDIVNFAGSLGHTQKGFDRIFIDLDSIDYQIKTLAGYSRKDLVSDGEKVSEKDLISIESWVRQFNSRENLKQLIVDDTKMHELAHKQYDDLKKNLTKGFGIYQSNFDNLRARDPQGTDIIQSEIYAYLTEIKNGNLPGLSIFILWRSFMKQVPTAEFFAGCFILNQLTGDELNPKNGMQHVFERVAELLNMPKIEISKKAEKVLQEFFADKAMNISDHTGGIDFTADKTPLEIKNIGKDIKFNIDAAMLQKLQNTTGFEPLIIDIQPMTDLKAFLELK
ncbi:MAG: hypothetical protein HQL25_03695 [Candidatus Omnitrophica bacterium]|nr:hypothetical protein [Candidatus Omnitrophota bacterium]